MKMRFRNKSANLDLYGIQSLFFVIILFYLASCFGPDYTGIVVEDRITIKLDKDRTTLETKCDSLLTANDSLNIVLDVFFPENFDHIQSYFTNQCTYTRADQNSFVVNIGRVKDVGAYIIIDEENDVNRLFFYSDRNTFDGAWLFKYGHMEEYKKSIFDFTIINDTLVLRLDAHKRTPLYHINDRSMSNLQGYSDSNLHGCAQCIESDSAILSILDEERVYYNLHKEAIELDSMAYMRKIRKRLGL